MSILSKTLEIELSPEDLADVFANMSSGEQAAFFNRVGEVAKGWPNGGWCQQASYIVTDADLNEVGREAIRRLGEHILTEVGLFQPGDIVTWGHGKYACRVVSDDITGLVLEGEEGRKETWGGSRRPTGLRRSDATIPGPIGEAA